MNQKENARRCACCDGPDGRGLFHVVGPLATLEAFLDEHPDAEWIAYEPRRGIAVTLSSVAAARLYVDDVIHDRHEQYLDDWCQR